jgi:hypothetical protein
MGLALEIADAVTAEINASALLSGLPGGGVTAKRQVLPEFEIKDLAELKVTVVPRSVNITGATRASSQYEIAIDIGLQKKITSNASGSMDTEVATLGTLVDQITSYLQRRPLAGFPWATWVSITNDPIYVPEHLAQQSVFTSALTVTYRAIQ